MPLKRFLMFLSCCRFDDKATRKEKQSVDKLAPIRLMMDNFVDKCAKAYDFTASPHVCVDETLVGFCGKCPFRVYIPSKPDKYGIKVWSMCDTGTNYLVNMQVHLYSWVHVDPSGGQRYKLDKWKTNCAWNQTTIHFVFVAATPKMSPKNLSTQVNVRRDPSEVLLGSNWTPAVVKGLSRRSR